MQAASTLHRQGPEGLGVVHACWQTLVSWAQPQSGGRSERTRQQARGPGADFVAPACQTETTCLLHGWPCWHSVLVRQRLFDRCWCASWPKAGRQAATRSMCARVVRKKTLRDSPVHNDGWCLAGVMSEVQQQLLVMAARNRTQSRLEPQHKALCELASNGLECDDRVTTVF